MSDSLARNILRVWYSVASAYPDAGMLFRLTETARQAHCSRGAVRLALRHSF